MLQKITDEDIYEFVRIQLTLPEELDPSDQLSWQHHLYSTLGSKKSIPAHEMKPEALDHLIRRIVAMGKVLFGLHMVGSSRALRSTLHTVLKTLRTS